MKYIIDLHTHTIAGGHAYSTFQENVLAAYEKGMAVYGVSEHAPAMPGGPHEFFFGNLKVLPGTFQEMRILKGCEANVVDLDGHLDLSDAQLAKLDYVIASMHIPCVTGGTTEENTDCLIKVMEHPCVQIIGHPDDARYPLEYERLVKAAKENQVLLELNNSSLSPASVRVGAVENAKTYLTLCKKYQVPIILGTDSHYASYIGDFANAEALLASVDFPEELVVNTDVEKLRKYVKNL